MLYFGEIFDFDFDFNFWDINIWRTYDYLFDLQLLNGIKGVVLLVYNFICF
jgi:hypothetical protein